MPLFLDPEGKHRVVLISDKDKPQANQPAFFFKVLTVRQRMELIERNDMLDDIDDTAEAVDHEVETLKKYLVGWENMKMIDDVALEFRPEMVEDVLTWFEVVELNQALLLARPDFLKRKLSESPSPSDTEPLKTAESVGD